MKLFVDDKREQPKYFNCAVDYNGAVSLLSLLDFDFITLDYDLGDGPNGLDVLKYIHENKKYPQQLNIHSTHSEGQHLMRRYAEENFPKTVSITMNKFKEK